MSMLTNPKVSFIVPSYNYGRYITQCVESIQNQTYHNVEILIINDGSTDNSKQVIDELAAKDNRIIAIHTTNKGVSSARNVGINNSTGDYLVFVDADDFLAPDYASYMLDIASKTNASFVLSLNCFTRNDEAQNMNDNIKLIFANFYRDFKRKFSIPILDDLAPGDLESAFEFIHNWREDKNLKRK